MDHENEDILVRLAKDVDGNYPRLLSMYIDQLYAHVVRRITNEDDAEDILQDISVCVYLALKRYPVERILQLQLRPWLYKITENACLNYQTRYQARRPLSLDTSEGSSYLEIPDTRCELPDTIAERHEVRNELLNEIANIPKKYRDPIFWHFFNDLSYDEIAARLQQKAATVRIHVHRGISHLRQTLEKQQQEQYRKHMVPDDE